jgi:hypothetical protein
MNNRVHHMEQKNSQTWSVGCSECSGGEEGEDGVRVPKMVWEKCALHEK